MCKSQRVATMPWLCNCFPVSCVAFCSSCIYSDIFRLGLRIACGQVNFAVLAASWPCKSSFADIGRGIEAGVESAVDPPISSDQPSRIKIE